MKVNLTEKEFLSLFVDVPEVRKAENGYPLCPYCGNAFSDDAIEVYECMTEAGTDYSYGEIDCDMCDKTMWSGRSWFVGEYPPTFDDIREVLSDIRWDRTDEDS